MDKGKSLGCEFCGILLQTVLHCSLSYLPVASHDGLSRTQLGGGSAIGGGGGGGGGEGTGA